MLFANEENGTRGGLKYAEENGAKEKHIFALESDAGGYSPIGFFMDVTSNQKADVKNWMKLFAHYNVHNLADSEGGTDIAPLKKIWGIYCWFNAGFTKIFRFAPLCIRYF